MSSTSTTPTTAFGYWRTLSASRGVGGGGNIDTSASDVLIRDLMVEKAANRYQGLGGLYGSGARTTIQGVTRRLHDANALRLFRDDSKVVNNKLIDNGLAGVIGSRDRMLVEGNEIAGNNWPASMRAGKRSPSCSRLLGRSSETTTCTTTTAWACGPTAFTPTSHRFT